MTCHIPTFPALLDALRHVVPINAATALRYHETGADRIFSSHPDRFANTGSKRFEDAPTMQRVRMAETPILTEGTEALREEFGDWQTILTTGSDAILNVPVRAPSGEPVGQLNLMGRSGDFAAGTPAVIQRIANRAVDCFLDPTREEARQCR